MTKRLPNAYQGVKGLKIHHIPPPPTKNQATLPSSSTHPQASSVQKKSLPGAGGVFLAKGKRELEVAEAVRREAMQQPAGANERAAQQVATRLPDGASKGDGALRGCGATRSHATTRTEQLKKLGTSYTT